MRSLGICDRSVTVLEWYQERIRTGDLGICDRLVTVLEWYQERIRMGDLGICDRSVTVFEWYQERIRTGDLSKSVQLCKIRNRVEFPASTKSSDTLCAHCVEISH